MRSAMWVPSSASAMLSSRIANSSPPKRPITSPGRMQLKSRLARTVEQLVAGEVAQAVVDRA